MRLHSALLGVGDLGITCPAGLVATPEGTGCVDPNSVQAARLNASQPPKAVNYASAPGCNVVDLTKNECMLDDGTITGCNIIQECAPLTGQQRCQFGPFPGQTADPTLPFCTGGGPEISYTPSTVLTPPSGPSTPYTPTMALLSPNAAPVGSGISTAQMAALVKASGSGNVIGAPTPAPTAIIPATPAPAASSGTGAAAAAATSPAATSFDLSTFLTESPLGIPNWAIGIGLAAVLYFVAVKK